MPYAYASTYRRCAVTGRSLLRAAAPHAVHAGDQLLTIDLLRAAWLADSSRRVRTWRGVNARNQRV